MGVMLRLAPTPLCVTPKEQIAIRKLMEQSKLPSD
jgi:hypothetical protein